MIDSIWIDGGQTKMFKRNEWLVSEQNVGGATEVD